MAKIIFSGFYGHIRVSLQFISQRIPKLNLHHTSGITMLSLFLRLRLTLSLSLSLSIISSLSAQESNSGAWYMYFGNQAFHQRWNWHNELQYRNYNLVGDLEQIVLRTGIGYNL
ncbi:MAG TPA: DUF2490 domain-containing protein, partial [Saprospiraceae bacterium]